MSIGWPVLPQGVSVSCQVKLSEVQTAMERLLQWVKENEGTWRQLPTTGPDTVPGGSPAYVNDEDWPEARRVGYHGG